MVSASNNPAPGLARQGGAAAPQPARGRPAARPAAERMPMRARNSSTCAAFCAGAEFSKASGGGPAAEREGGFAPPGREIPVRCFGGAERGQLPAAGPQVCGFTLNAYAACHACARPVRGLMGPSHDPSYLAIQWLCPFIWAFFPPSFTASLCLAQIPSSCGFLYCRIAGPCLGHSDCRRILNFVPLIGPSLSTVDWFLLLIAVESPIVRRL